MLEGQLSIPQDADTPVTLDPHLPRRCSVFSALIFRELLLVFSGNLLPCGFHSTPLLPWSCSQLCPLSCRSESSHPSIQQPCEDLRVVPQAPYTLERPRRPSSRSDFTTDAQSPGTDPSPLRGRLSPSFWWGTLTVVF